MSGFAAVAENGVGEGDGGTVVHQAGMKADAPERSSSDFVGGVLAFGVGEIFPGLRVKSFSVMLDEGLDDAITGADVVQQEVAVRMKGFLAERGRNCEVAAVDYGGRGRSGESCDVAIGAADFVEERCAVFGFGSLGELSVAGGGFGSTNEAGEVVDVSEPVGSGLIIGLFDGVTKIGDFVRLERIGDAHFVEVGVGGEGEQAGVLIFPPEAADAGVPGGFDDGDVESLAADFAMILLTLVLGEVEQGLIGKGFDKTVAE